jgi:hypothetical protein
MTIKLVIEGPQPYCMTDGEVARVMARSPRPAPSPVPQRVSSLGVLERLAQQGSLRKVQVEAGLEVRAYWHMWTRAFSAGICRYGELPRGDDGVVEAPSVRSLVARYRLWATAAEAQRVKGELTALQLVCDLCVADRPPLWMRREYRMSDVRALRVVRESLLDYARLNGWREAA